MVSLQWSHRISCPSSVHITLFHMSVKGRSGTDFDGRPDITFSCGDRSICAPVTIVVEVKRSLYVSTGVFGTPTTIVRHSGAWILLLVLQNRYCSYRHVRNIRSSLDEDSHRQGSRDQVWVGAHWSQKATACEYRLRDLPPGTRVQISPGFSEWAFRDEIRIATQALV